MSLRPPSNSARVLIWLEAMIVFVERSSSMRYLSPDLLDDTYFNNNLAMAVEKESGRLP